MDHRITAAEGSAELAAITEGLLALLPTWFGIPESNAGYVAAARTLPGFVAHAEDRQPVGVLLHDRHFPECTEIHLMAVHPDRHRHGIGRALVGALVDSLTGTRLVQVKTLGPAHPDQGYARTREFYRAIGFLPVEQTDALWPGMPCLIMVKPLA